MGDSETKLWDAVCVTDEEFVKKVNQRGGFTAIDAYYQIRCATAQWGPYGTMWKLERPQGYASQYEYITDKDGDIVEVAADFLFRYPGGTFEVSVDAKYRAGGDTRKKLRTDALTKALSYLGFNADVFMGRFDGNKYLDENKGGSKTKPKHGNIDVQQAAKKFF